MSILDLKPRHIILSLVIVFLVAYSLFQARFIILGPQITITSHTDGQVVASSVVTLEGVAKNVSRISLNDRQIFTDESGLWSEKLIVSSGTSIMTLKAKDRFGRETTKTIRIILN